MSSQYWKGAYVKDGNKLFTGICGNRTSGNNFKLKNSGVRLDRDILFYSGASVTQEQLSQRDDGCRIP